jgi:hypothetical protein
VYSAFVIYIDLPLVWIFHFEVTSIKHHFAFYNRMGLGLLGACDGRRQARHHA